MAAKKPEGFIDTSLLREVNNRVKRIERRQEHIIEALIALLGTPDPTKLAELTQRLTASAESLGASVEANK